VSSALSLYVEAHSAQCINPIRTDQPSVSLSGRAKGVVQGFYTTRQVHDERYRPGQHILAEPCFHYH
jgi:hypothetical protein